MENPKPAYEFMLEGEYNKATERLTRDLERRPRDMGAHSNRALAYMALRDYAKAESDFAIVAQVRSNTDSSYINLGISQWCQMRYVPAIATWRMGLNTGYTDAAGGVEVPALLFYAALRLQDAHLIEEALHLLRKKQRSRRLIHWPGAVLPYLLGRMSDDELRAAASSTQSDPLRGRWLCQAAFYVGVRALSIGNRGHFEQAMRECAGSPRGLLEHEWYLANWEVDRGFPEIANTPST